MGMEEVKTEKWWSFCIIIIVICSARFARPVLVFAPTQDLDSRDLKTACSDGFDSSVSDTVCAVDETALWHPRIRYNIYSRFWQLQLRVTKVRASTLLWQLLLTPRLYTCQRQAQNTMETMDVCVGPWWKLCEFIVQELCESRGGRPGLSVLTSLQVSVDVKNYWTVLRHWSQLALNMSTDIWGH